MSMGTIVGILMALVGVFVAMILEGGNPASLLAPPAIILILFGSFGAATGGSESALPSTLSSRSSWR